MDVRVPLAVIVTIASVLAAGTPGRAAFLPCPGGRFLVEGPALVPGISPPASDAIALANGQVSIESGCPAVAAVVRGNRRYTRIRARWDACGFVPGPVRLRARIETGQCGTMTGRLLARAAGVRRDFTAAREAAPPPPPPGGCDQGETFTVIQDRIFTARGCDLATCHGNFMSANLDLRPGASHVNLVGVLADNGVARTAGKLRVAPGDPAASFLSQKLRGALALGEGGIMPAIGPTLPQIEIDLIDAWIAGGAPATGVVPGAPCLPAESYAPATPPPPPPGGYQIVLDGPWLQPGQEQEGCLWIPVPNATDFAVGRWEFALNPGTHHFSIFEYNRTGTPPLGVWSVNDFGCFSGAMFGNSITGSPQSPHFIDAYPPGVARVLRAGTYIGLNAHYRNVFDEPIQVKVWTNAHPYDGVPQHVAQTIVEIDDTFTISVPAFTQRVHPGRFHNTLGRPMSIIQLSGHMHQRGLRFTATDAGGTKLYENFNWSHPAFRNFDPPLVLPAGGYIDYECLHDNGVTRPVRLNASGSPTTLVFGVTTEDEMCILTGQYYTD